MDHMTSRQSKGAALALCLLSATSLAMARSAPPSKPPPVNGAMIRDAGDGTNWPSYGRTYDENHFSPLREINRQSIGKLGLAWSFDLGTLQRSDSQLLEANGIVFAASGLSVLQAIDVRSGKLLWRYDPDVASVAGARLRSGWGIRGLALWQDEVIAGTQDGRLIAVDAKTGQLRWSTQALAAGDETAITGAPRVFNGKVVIGYAGGDRRQVRGALLCFDARTGKFLWRFYTTPGDPSKGFENDAMRLAAKSWNGAWWRFGGGGTVWNAITYDPELDRIYIGTGNGEPWNPAIRSPKGGDNLFICSIVALDAKTGAYVWHYQVSPRDAWDYDATEDIELATLSINGAKRRVLLQAPKNGFLFVLDRNTGKLIAASKIGKVSWASGYDLKTGRPIEAPGIRYETGPVLMWPGTFGTHNWQPMSYDPRTGLLFIPTINAAGAYAGQGLDPRTWKPVANAWNTGLAFAAGKAGEVEIPAGTFGSSLQARNPLTGQQIWSIANPGIVNGGTMATAGGLVFQGLIDGTLNALLVGVLPALDPSFDGDEAALREVVVHELGLMPPDLDVEEVCVSLVRVRRLDALIDGDREGRVVLSGRGGAQLRVSGEAADKTDAVHDWMLV